MKLCLDRSLSDRLRNAINEYPNFISGMQAGFSVPGKRNKTVESDAYNCVCAVMDRVDELVDYCNSLTLERSEEGLHALYDLFTHGQVLIDCITRIAGIFDTSYESAKDVTSFHESGLTGKGNDEKYFKYLRSLCFVHPVDTTGHPDYQGNEPEWCPYISGDSDSIYTFLQGDNRPKADFYAVVYRNDLQFGKYVPIYLSQVCSYIRKRYDFLNTVIKQIHEHYENRIEELKRRHILTPAECTNYDDYLYNLGKEIQDRCGSGDEYKIREWQAVFHSSFEDLEWQTILSEYQQDLRKGIAEVHQRLQNMEESPEGISLIAIWEGGLKVPTGYAYELSKIEYLFPMHILSDWSVDITTLFAEPLSFNLDKYNEAASLIEKMQNNDCSHKEIRSVVRDMQYERTINDSEWARLQLKVIEPFFPTARFNYDSSDWELYLQIHLLAWHEHFKEIENTTEA